MSSGKPKGGSGRGRGRGRGRSRGGDRASVAPHAADTSTSSSSGMKVEGDFMFSFKLEGVKRKERRKRRELLGFDSSGRRTDDFDRVEDRLMTFLHTRGAAVVVDKDEDGGLTDGIVEDDKNHDGPPPSDHNSPSSSAASSSTNSSSSSSSPMSLQTLMESFKMHPFGSGLHHLRPGSGDEGEEGEEEGAGVGTGAAGQRKGQGTSAAGAARKGQQRQGPPKAKADGGRHQSRSSGSGPVTSVFYVIDDDDDAEQGPMKGTTKGKGPMKGKEPKRMTKNKKASSGSAPQSMSALHHHHHHAKEARVEVAQWGEGGSYPPSAASRTTSSLSFGAVSPDTSDRSNSCSSPSSLSPRSAASHQGTSPPIVQSYPMHTSPSGRGGVRPEPFRSVYDHRLVETRVTDASPFVQPSAAAYGQGNHLFGHSLLPPLESSVPSAASRAPDDAGDSLQSSWHSQPKHTPIRAKSSGLVPILPDYGVRPTHAHIDSNQQLLPPHGSYSTSSSTRTSHKRALSGEDRQLVLEGRRRLVHQWHQLEQKGLLEASDVDSALRYKMQKLDRLSRRTDSLWNEDGHLSFFTTISEYIRLYVVHSWPSCPLHPLALSEDNLLRFLCSGEEEYGTPLTLNIFVGLALGAMLMGDKERAFVYYKHARRELEQLFDTSDYSVAEALFGLTYIAFGNGSMKKALYYTTLAMQICRQHNALHSSVYNRCLMTMFFVPTSTIEEKRRLWNEYTASIERNPYYDDARLQLFITATTDTVQLDPYHPDSGGSHSFLNLSNKISTTESMRQNVQQAQVIDRIARNSMAIFLTFHVLDQKCEEKKQSLQTSNQNVLIQDLFTDTSEIRDVFQVLNLLASKVRTVEQLLQTEAMPASLRVGTEISLFALYSELNRRLGRTADAFKWAKKCVQKLEQADSQYLPVGIMSSIILVLNTFFSYNKYHRVLQLLKALRAMANIYPSVQFLQKSYLERLKATPGVCIDSGDMPPSTEPRHSSLDTDENSPSLPYPHASDDATTQDGPNDVDGAGAPPHDHAVQLSQGLSATLPRAPSFSRTTDGLYEEALTSPSSAGSWSYSSAPPSAPAWQPPSSSLPHDAPLAPDLSAARDRPQRRPAFISKLRQFTRREDSGDLTVQSLGELMDEFTAFLEEADL